MKPETNRQQTVETSIVYDEQPHTPLLDAAVDRLMFPLLHAVCDQQEECQSRSQWGKEMQAKRQYAPWHCASCGREGRVNCRPTNAPRGRGYDS